MGMADVKWIKLATNLFDNRKIRQIECLPDGFAIIVVWVKLLCLAGNVNDSGMVYFTKEIPYTDQMLSAQFNMPLTTVQLALRTFQQFGMIDVIDNMLYISNWEKYQSVDRLAEIREYNRIAKQKSRAKQKALADVNDKSMTSQRCHDTDIDKEEDKDKKKNKKKIENKSYSDDPELNQAILAFVEYRKSVKKPMTDHAIKLLISKLNGMTTYIPEQIEILNQSIVNGWQGIFPLKDNQPVRQGGYQKQTKAEELNEFYAMAARWSEED
jgi:predicted phage replisome organizer